MKPTGITKSQLRQAFLGNLRQLIKGNYAKFDLDGSLNYRDTIHQITQRAGLPDQKFGNNFYVYSRYLTTAMEELKESGFVTVLTKDNVEDFITKL